MKGTFIAIKKPKDRLLNTHGSEMLKTYQIAKRDNKDGNSTNVQPICSIPEVLTNRMILSQVNSIYDPLGLDGPYTVRAKILMRKLWTGLGRSHTRRIRKRLPEMEKITVKRCLTPRNAIGDPMLIIFSDGSTNAYGTCAYVRWELSTREFVSYLIVSKNRLAPVKRMSIERIELCGAILNKRLKTVLQQL